VATLRAEISTSPEAGVLPAIVDLGSFKDFHVGLAAFHNAKEQLPAHASERAKLYLDSGLSVLKKSREGPRGTYQSRRLRREARGRHGAFVFCETNFSSLPDIKTARSW